jgi:hypothetical protein
MAASGVEKEPACNLAIFLCPLLRVSVWWYPCPMNSLVIEHVALSELPGAWRARLDVASNTRVTVRIEEEVSVLPQSMQTATVDNPLFGMWQDREEVADVGTYARALRSPRFDLDGSRITV